MTREHSPAQRELFAREPKPIGEVEAEAMRLGYDVIIGVDEAGRGPLAGPVTAAAVALDMRALGEGWVSELDDSKKLKESVREHLFDIIQERAIATSVRSKPREVIDEINILQATRQAMKEAIEQVCDLLDVPVDRVYIDGKQFVDVALAQSAVIKGDARSFHIAAASILAKVTRDREMRLADEQWPEYGFARNKGYGTKDHRRAIAEHGPCLLHRASFGGVREHWDRVRTTPGA